MFSVAYKKELKHAIRTQNAASLVGKLVSGMTIKHIEEKPSNIPKKRRLEKVSKPNVKASPYVNMGTRVTVIDKTPAGTFDAE